MFVRALAILLALSTPAAARADWFVADSKHFQIFAEDQRSLEKFANDIERFDSALRVTYGVPPSDIAPVNRVTIYIASPAFWQRLTNNAPLAGFYIARPGRPVAFSGTESATGATRNTLLHEYVHHFLTTNAPNTAFPRWFSEGFAETMATAVFEKDGAITLGHPPHFRAYEILGPDSPTPEELLTHAKLRASREASFYGAGWLLTHYLLFSGSRSDQFKAYIRALNDDASHGQALQVFGDLKALNREIRAYKSNRFPALRVAPSALKTGAIRIRQLSDAESAIMPVRIYTERGVAPKEAVRQLSRAKQSQQNSPPTRRFFVGWPKQPLTPRIMQPAKPLPIAQLPLRPPTARHCSTRPARAGSYSRREGLGRPQSGRTSGAHLPQPIDRIRKTRTS